jgi:hypothetical protein
VRSGGVLSGFLRGSEGDGGRRWGSAPCRWWWRRTARLRRWLMAHMLPGTGGGHSWFLWLWRWRCDRDIP